MATGGIQQTLFLHAALSLLVLRAEGKMINFFLFTEARTITITLETRSSRARLLTYRLHSPNEGSLVVSNFTFL